MDTAVQLPEVELETAAGAKLSHAQIARAARDAALGVEGVSAVVSPTAPRVVTYGLAGETVPGVRVRSREGRIDLTIYAEVRPVPLIALAREIRQAVAAAVGVLVECRRVDIFIEGLDEVECEA